MKVFFNRVPRNEPYGGGNQFLVTMVDHLVKHGHEVTFHLEEGVDAIFLMDPRPGDIGYSIQHVGHYKQQFPQTKILHRINECDERKGTNYVNKYLMNANKIADHTIFVSKWLKNLYMIKDILAGKKINENEVNKIKIDFDFPEWLQNDKLPFANFKKTSTYNLKLDVKKINYIRTEIDTITLVSGDKQRGFARYMERRSSESNFFKKEFQKIA